MNRIFRYVWAGPTTLIGLTLALALFRRGRVAIVDGVVEAHGPLLERALALFTPLARGADAVTLGPPPVFRQSIRTGSVACHTVSTGFDAALTRHFVGDVKYFLRFAL